MQIDEGANPPRAHHAAAERTLGAAHQRPEVEFRPPLHAHWPVAGDTAQSSGLWAGLEKRAPGGSCSLLIPDAGRAGCGGKLSITASFQVVCEGEADRLEIGSVRFRPRLQPLRQVGQCLREPLDIRHLGTFQPEFPISNSLYLCWSLVNRF